MQLIADPLTSESLQQEGLPGLDEIRDKAVRLAAVTHYDPLASLPEDDAGNRLLDLDGAAVIALLRPPKRPDREIRRFVVRRIYQEYSLATLDGLEGLLPGIQIRRLDTFSLLNALVADPESAGLENVTDACLTFGVVGRAICKRPNRHLFWDAAHPTAAGHGAVADAAAQVLSAP